MSSVAKRVLFVAILRIRLQNASSGSAIRIERPVRCKKSFFRELPGALSSRHHGCPAHLNQSHSRLQAESPIGPLQAKATLTSSCVALAGLVMMLGRPSEKMYLRFIAQSPLKQAPPRARRPGSVLPHSLSIRTSCQHPDLSGGTAWHSRLWLFIALNKSYNGSTGNFSDVSQ